MDRTLPKEEVASTIRRKKKKARLARFVLTPCGYKPLKKGCMLQAQKLFYADENKIK